MTEDFLLDEENEEPIESAYPEGLETAWASGLVDEGGNPIESIETDDDDWDWDDECEDDEDE